MPSKLIHLDKERMKRRGDRKMGSVEQLDEAAWLLGGGLIPIVVAEQLGTNLVALAKAAYRHKRDDLHRIFDAAAQREETRQRSAKVRVA